MLTIFRKGILFFLSALMLGVILGCLLHPSTSSPEPTSPISPPQSPTPTVELPRILLDPGHGGWDGGTHDNRGLKEKDIALKFSFLLKTELERLGFPVAMTRATDRELSEFAPYQGTRQRTDLCARARMIKQHEADLFLSIHVNAASNPNLCGAITFHQRKSLESKRFAQSIQNAIQSVQPYNRQTILPGNFYLLNASPIPAALLEIAFITNPTEHTLLQDPEFLQKMAHVVTQGIYQYVLEKTNETFEFMDYKFPLLKS